ncbi:hypothetical protein J6590_034259 [Homalodisca vitripennis]|nr:hypothetical protein J6590_034259 [Homalodisca vitripennis]
MSAIPAVRADLANPPRRSRSSVSLPDKSSSALSSQPHYTLTKSPSQKPIFANINRHVPVLVETAKVNRPGLRRISDFKVLIEWLENRSVREDTSFYASLSSEMRKNCAALGLDERRHT